MQLLPDFIDFISALNQAEVDYMIVGGYAVIYHGYLRTTMDIDIWINRTESNYQKIVKAYHIFGMPVFDFTYENFLNPAFDVFGIGRKPVRIEILLEVKGLIFSDAYKQCVNTEIKGLPTKFLSLTDLIEAKKAAGRHKDLDDIEKLESGE